MDEDGIIMGMTLSNIVPLEKLDIPKTEIDFEIEAIRAILGKYYTSSAAIMKIPKRPIRVFDYCVYSESEIPDSLRYDFEKYGYRVTIIAATYKGWKYQWFIEIKEAFPLSIDENQFKIEFAKEVILKIDKERWE